MQPMRRIFPPLLLVVLGCSPDDAYAEVALRHIETGGPSAACCSPHGFGNPPVSPTCKEDAEKECAFARGATIAKPKVNAPPRGMPTVSARSVGPERQRPVHRPRIRGGHRSREPAGHQGERLLLRATLTIG